MEVLSAHRAARITLNPGFNALLVEDMFCMAGYLNDKFLACIFLQANVAWLGIGACECAVLNCLG
jgi:hypothetical protein